MQTTTIDKEQDARRVCAEAIRRVQAPGFFGSVTIEITSQNGKIHNALARVSTTIK